MNPKTLPLIALLSGLAACATMTPEAERVQLHGPDSVALASCQKLGLVSGKGSRAWSYEDAIEAGRIAMRHQAYIEFRADAVAHVSNDVYWNRIITRGVAYRCAP